MNSNFLTNNSGVNSINLRNLGDQRTLVLANGKRDVPGISGISIVDFNTIPTGSDAIAGVVNVLNKTNFEGLQFRGQAGETGGRDDARYGGGLLAPRGK